MAALGEFDAICLLGLTDFHDATRGWAFDGDPSVGGAVAIGDGQATLVDTGRELQGVPRFQGAEDLSVVSGIC